VLATADTDVGRGVESRRHLPSYIIRRDTGDNREAGTEGESGTPTADDRGAILRRHADQDGSNELARPDQTAGSPIVSSPEPPWLGNAA